MKKAKYTDSIGKRELLMHLCEVIVDSYGNTIVEGDTDLKMAENIAKELKSNLMAAGTQSDIPPKAFKTWRQKFVAANRNITPGEVEILPKNYRHRVISND